MEQGRIDWIVWATADRTFPGQKESGDRSLVRAFANGVLVAVVDGLGHGQEAAHAAGRLVRSLEEAESASLISVVRHCHQDLQGTRGAVLSVAFFSHVDSTMTWLGVGNIEGVLIHPEGAGVPAREYLLLRGGVLGSHLPRLSAAILPVAKGDLLIFATDGVRMGFASNQNGGGQPVYIAEQILDQHWRGDDDALVLVARCMNESN